LLHDWPRRVGFILGELGFEVQGLSEGVRSELLPVQPDARMRDATMERGYINEAPSTDIASSSISVAELKESSSRGLSSKLERALRTGPGLGSIRQADSDYRIAGGLFTPGESSAPMLICVETG
jgi:hypothetical protein